jgi:cytochrome c553
MKTWHLKVRYDPVSEVLVYERTLVPGPGSSLYGLEVARAMNLPMGVLDAATKIRHRLMGTTTQIDAQASQWNTAIQRNKCEVCGHGIVKDLEVHHIRQRSDAKDGKFADGSRQDDIRNLLVVCATCHDRHHANEISIQGLVQTSEGLARSVTGTSVASTSESRRRSKWSDDEIKIIQEYISKYPSAPMKRIVFELKERENITISAASLTKFASTG